MRIRILTHEEMLDHVFNGGIVEYNGSIKSNKELMNLSVKCWDKWIKKGVYRVKK